MPRWSTIRSQIQWLFRRTRPWPKRWRPWAAALLLLSLPILAWAATIRTTSAPTGTITSSTASVLTFSSELKSAFVVSNRNGTSPVYVKLNDSSVTPLVSATVYDLVLDKDEMAVLGRLEIQNFPIKTVGVYTEETTATLKVRIVGW